MFSFRSFLHKPRTSRRTPNFRSSFVPKMSRYHWKKMSTPSINQSQFLLKSLVALTTGTITYWYLWTQPVSMASPMENEFIVEAASGNLNKLKETVTKLCGNDAAKIKKLVNTPHVLGWTALHAAACNNQFEVVKWLVENGADVNAKDLYNPVDNQFAYLRSSEFSHLINDRLDCRGWTPLHYAVGFGNVKVTEYLLQHGSNPKLTNNRGHIPEKYIDTSTSEGRLLIKLFEDAVQKNTELEKAERLRYPLEKKLTELMVAQVMPIHSVSAAIRRRQNGWHDDDKPLVFMFLGSSGVGKTMLAKCVAEHLIGGKENGFIRIDMSEYAHKHEVSKFIGAPPGYIGYEEGGQLTEKLKKCPNAVVLLDEVEKAHTDLLTIMLQVFDEGRLTDGRGNTVDCRDAIFIMTSNLVQDEIHDTHLKIRPEKVIKDIKKLSGEQKPSMVFEDFTETVKDIKKFTQLIVQPILKRHFKRDEFLGRINEFVIFHPFNDQDLETIVNTELNKWKVRALTRHNIVITWDKEIIPLLAEGFNPSYGFRSIKHEVEKQVINTIAAAYERDDLKVGHSVELGLGEDAQSIVLKNIKPNDLSKDQPNKSLWPWG